MSGNHTSHFSHNYDPLSPPKPTTPNFEDLGVRPSVAKALRNAFPNITTPTETQSRLIPAVIGERDVIIIDDTGSGKSFGLLIALLNKPRIRYKDENGEPRQKLATTSLYLVPHKDLANQLYAWIQRMAEASRSHGSPSISAVAQVLVRDGGNHLTTGLETLKADPPHILIATPQAVADVAETDPTAISFLELSTIVVDEIDYLVQAVRTPKDPEQQWKMRSKAARIRKHPGVTTQLLDRIYKSRIDFRDLELDSNVVNTAITPQLIVASATVRQALVGHLVSAGWIDMDRTELIRGQNYYAKSEEVSNRGLGGVGIQHSVVVCNIDGVTNIPEAEPSPEDITLANRADTDDSVANIDASNEDKQIYAVKPTPFNMFVFEAIAAAFALDVPSLGLLVLHPESSVKRAVYDLRRMGVDAVALDIKDNDRGGAHLMTRTTGHAKFTESPVLFVCTRATARGVDLPELTHVFIVDMFQGYMSGELVDEYLHIAGRVGRFGRGGKVITFIGDSKARDDSSPSRNEVPRVLKVLSSIGAKPVVFKHFAKSHDAASNNSQPPWDTPDS